MSKKTVVIGASPKQDRYSYLATLSLREHGHEVVPVGLHNGEIHGIPIHTSMPEVEGTDTVTLYVAPRNQPYWYDYVLGLKPRRIIFNPGTENPELYSLARESGIECLPACTLVLLSIGKY